MHPRSLQGDRRRTGRGNDASGRPIAQRQHALWLFGLVVRARARLTGKRFACDALSGRSRYNVSINADMTLSCTCNDQDGSGFLGDLDTHSFDEIFSGPRVRRFRQELAAGRLPVPRCPACTELRLVSRTEANARVEDFALPTALMVENTSACNLACTSCSREALRLARRRTTLSGPEVSRVAEILRKNGTTLLHYFKLGEPFVSSSIREELETIRAANPGLVIVLSTNGTLLDSDEKREAALLLDDLVFSIDGIDTPMVQRYQKGGDFERAYENMKRLVAYRDERGAARPNIGWRYVVFRWNDRRRTIERATELARAAGVDYLELVFAKTPVLGISLRRLLDPFYRRFGEQRGAWVRRLEL